MSDESLHLKLPYIAANQAQKHVTHNEAIRLLDGLVQLSVKSRTLTSPPGSPADGDRYIVASGATGLWSGWDLNIAYWVDGAWMKLVPKAGWLAWIEAEAIHVRWDGTAWGNLSSGGSIAWGAITGTLSSQTDLQAALNGKAAASHTHPAGEISDGTAAGRAMLTAADAAAQTALLDTVSSTAKGLAPSGGTATQVLKGDGTWGTVAAAGIANNAVANTKLADMAQNTLKGRASAGSGDPEDLTAAQATALFDTFTSASKGLAPASGGGTASFLRADGAWAAPPGGSSGDVVGPASAADNALARFDGTTGKLIQNSGILVTDSDEMLFPAVAAPAAPSAGNLHRFAQSIGGRMLPTFKGPTGLERATQPFLGRGRFARWHPAGGNTTIALDGAGTTVASGTATARAPASTRLFTSMRRLGYVSAATAGSSCGVVTHNQLVFWRGNAAGLGGFHALFTFGVADAAAVADARLFAGLYSAASGIGNVNPSTLLNMVGVGCDNGQTTLRIMSNDGAGAATTIDLGANFPSNTLLTDMYELALYAAPNGSSIDYRVTRLNTGDVATGSLATDLPVNTQFLSPQLWRNNGATALACAIDIASVYVETDT